MLRTAPTMTRRVVLTKRTASFTPPERNTVLWQHCAPCRAVPRPCRALPCRGVPLMIVVVACGRWQQCFADEQRGAPGCIAPAPSKLSVRSISLAATKNTCCLRRSGAERGGAGRAQRGGSARPGPPWLWLKSWSPGQGSLRCSWSCGGHSWRGVALRGAVAVTGRGGGGERSGAGCAAGWAGRARPGRLGELRTCKR